MRRLLGLLNKKRQSKSIMVVSGLPRSGTSLMMKMLEASGLTPLIDNERKADNDNPKGYYEFERVKKLDKGDTAWLTDAQGKVIKVISALLPHLPSTFNYRVLFIRRNITEILASQRKMLVNRGENTERVNDEELAKIFEKHLIEVENWMRNQTNIEYIDVNYNELIKDPGPQIAKINRFLGSKLDVRRMMEIIDPTLYRQRHAS